jgi:hypothetical protein
MLEKELFIHSLDLCHENLLEKLRVFFDLANIAVPLIGIIWILHLEISHILIMPPIKIKKNILLHEVLRISNHLIKNIHPENNKHN